jgi:hypothetical protein
LRLVAREKEVPARPVTGVRAQLLLEARQLLAREQRETNVHLGTELGAESAGGPARAAPSGRPIPLQHENAPATLLREVVGDASPDHPGADDDDLGGSHAATALVARMFNRT